MVIDLPWPPSVNRYWRRVGSKTLLSKDAREYHQAVLRVTENAEHFDVPVEVSILAYPPDRRRRDLDNVLKAILDSLEKAGVLKDDSLVDMLRIEREERMPGGMVSVRITRRAA